jgi:hypothetical protein
MSFRRRARRAASYPGRAASRARSTVVGVTTRSVRPLAAVGGLAVLALAASAASVPVPTASAATHVASVRPVPDATGPILGSKQLPAPLTTAQCQAAIGSPAVTRYLRLLRGGQ